MTDRFDQTYALYYWPHIPGRGEFVRLVLEEAGADYADVGRLPEDDGGGAEAVQDFLASDALETPAFAPPVLEHDDLVISQTANICLYLARRHDLVPDRERDRLHANQLQLTLQDFLREAHDTHHPISVMEYYEDQKEAALERAAAFRSNRIPKFLGYFERAVQNSGTSDPYLLGEGFSYVDLSTFHVLAGLEYAFPRAFAESEDDIPGLLELRASVAGRDRIDAYLGSDRRLPFNEHGIFRHYPELDAD